MKILVTGALGFIGSHLFKKLKDQGHGVVGLDWLFPDSSHLVHLRKTELCGELIRRIDIADSLLMDALFKEEQFDVVINLAAKAGVREKTIGTYTHSNLHGFSVVLEMCQKYKVKNLIYASSSSVYGNANLPADGHMIKLTETMCTDYPLSFYGATKKANELMAHAQFIQGLPSIGLRFFTVYGEYGRQDMAPWIFTESIDKGVPINLFGRGHYRDFTYIGDVVEMISRLVEVENKGCHVFNIGSGNPVQTTDFLKYIASLLGKEPVVVDKVPNKVEVHSTYADTSALLKFIDATGYEFTTTYNGMPRFVKWYQENKDTV